jgi:hypothetical protein
MHYLTVSTCIKGEDDYIDDFIRIHKALGVEHLIFWDRNGENLTNRYKGRDDITVIRYPEPNRHHESHGILIKNFQNFSRWFALIDCDQVLFSPTHTDLKVALQEYEKYAQVQINWETFGDSGHLAKTEGSVYERFTKRARSDAGINNHTQGIIDASRCQPITPPDPHRALVKPGQISVDENHRDVGITPHVSPHTQNKLFVAHYITKSQEEWGFKNKKGRSDVPGEKMPYDHYADHNSHCNEVEDTRIKDFWEKNCT